MWNVDRINLILVHPLILISIDNVVLDSVCLIRQDLIDLTYLNDGHKTYRHCLLNSILCLSYNTF